MQTAGTITLLPRLGEAGRGLQYSSPYIGMGNDPVNLVDPDGMTPGNDRHYEDNEGPLNFPPGTFSGGDTHPIFNYPFMDGISTGQIPNSTYYDYMNVYYGSGGGSYSSMNGVQFSGSPQNASNGLEYGSGTAGGGWPHYGSGSAGGGFSSARNGAGDGGAYEFFLKTGITRAEYQKMVKMAEISSSISKVLRDNNALASSYYATNGGGESGDNIFVKTYLHFQFGGIDPMTIDASTLDFGNISRSDLKELGNGRYGLNLYDKNPTSQAAIALGKITLIDQGNNNYSIAPDYYDFNIEWQNGFSKRNIATFGAGILHYGVNPVVPSYPLVPLIFGGPYWIHFQGNVHIKP